MPKVIQVIESEISRGDQADGTLRSVKQYHAPGGKFLAEIDPGFLGTSMTEQVDTILKCAQRWEKKHVQKVKGPHGTLKIVKHPLMERDLEVGKPPRRHKYIQVERKSFILKSSPRRRVRKNLCKSAKWARKLRQYRAQQIERMASDVTSGSVKQARKLLRKRGKHAHKIHR